MKYLLMIIAVVMIFAAPVLANDGNVSNDTLAKMGLSGMNAMSDAQGTSVRGMGFAYVNVTIYLVSGASTVTVNYGMSDKGDKPVAAVPAVSVSFGGVTANIPAITIQLPKQKHHH